MDTERRAERIGRVIDASNSETGLARPRGGPGRVIVYNPAGAFSFCRSLLRDDRRTALKGPGTSATRQACTLHDREAHYICEVGLPFGPRILAERQAGRPRLTGTTAAALPQTPDRAVALPRPK